MCKMPEKIDEDVFSNDDIDLDGIESDIVTFFSHNMGYSTIDLNNIIIDDDNFDDVPTSFVLVRLIDWSNRFKHRKAC